jgi:SAM-dependent methyltransferase
MEEIEKCRSCGNSEFNFIMSLGNQHITNFVSSLDEQGDPVPLDLVLCKECGLLQLKHNAPPESMWGDQYWYKSGISTTIKEDLKDIVSKAFRLANPKNEEVIIDIGCNDGTLLDFCKEENKNLTLVGFEPSKNVAREALAKGHKVINNFFNVENFNERFPGKKAKIITAIGMFYDLEDPNKFVRDVIGCLDKNGLFVIQQNYLLAMLEQNAFDNICHEHREYYSFTSLKHLLEKHGLDIFDVEQNDINGGSIRTYIKFKENQHLNGFVGYQERISSLEQKEQGIGLTTLKPFEDFASRISSIKGKLNEFLEKEKGKKIWIYGASTRGNVALQYFGLTPESVEFIADKNPDKWGKKTVGSLIPIVSPSEIINQMPDYLIVNTWHFLDEIIKQEREYFEKGGKFVVALPEFKIVSKN